MNYQKELLEAIEMANDGVELFGQKFEDGFPYEHLIPLEDGEGNKYRMKIVIDKI